jgi:phosphatidylinositol alpha-1,6-mannosyltransferase
MRLLIVTFDPPDRVGGVEGRARGYTKELLRKGHFAELLTLSSKSRFAEENFQGTTGFTFKSSLPNIPFSLRFAVQEMTRKSNDSLLLLSGANTFLGEMMLLHARLFRLRSLAFFYGKDVLEARRNPGRLALHYAALLLARRIAINSQFTRSLLPILVREKSDVLYPGVDSELAAGIKRREHDSRVVLFVGRLVRRKGVDDLIVAFRSLLEEVPTAELQIVGEGPERDRLVGLSKRLGVDRKVTFFGELRGSLLLDRFAAANVFVMPSRRTGTDVEGFGTVFLEAGIFGKPAVGTRSGGIPEAIVEGRTGLLSEPGDVQMLANCIKTLLINENLSSYLGHNARLRVIEHFSWEKALSSLLRAFSDNLGT